MNRAVYPEAQYPAGQWDYMLFYEESFEKACAGFDADPRNLVKALFRKGSPGGKGKPSRTAQTRKDGGWFGGTGQAPDVPMDADVVTAEELETYAAGLARNGFFGPDSWYMNAERNLEYAKRAKDGGVLEPARPVPARRVRLHLRDRRLPARRADAARLPEPHRGGRVLGTLDGAGEAASRERRACEVAGDPASRTSGPSDVTAPARRR